MAILRIAKMGNPILQERMTDLSLLAYNDEPGPLAKEVAANPKGIDPLFIDLVERWPGRQRWLA